MKYKELKDKILDLLDESGKYSVMALIVDVFQQYEKENQASENPSVISQLNAITQRMDSMQNEINIHVQREHELRAQINDLKEQIEQINSEVLCLMNKTKNIGKNKYQPRQERFYYKKWGDYKFEIVDRLEIIETDSIFSENQVVEMCQILNQMEGGK